MDNIFEAERELVLHHAFNQDASCVAIGTSQGVYIYNCEPFQLRHAEVIAGVALVEMRLQTSLLGIVGAGDQEEFSPRCLKLWNTRTKSSLRGMGFVSRVLAVKLNRKHLVVCLAQSLYIFDLGSMSKLQDIDTQSSTRGVIALTVHEDRGYLAYPGTDPGVVILHDINDLRMANKIAAHRSQLAAISFSLSGALIATASDKGTIIRVFSVPTGDCLHTLRRGRQQSIIYSLAFNHAGTRLAVSSSMPTVHVFQLPQPGEDGHTAARQAQECVPSQHSYESEVEELPPMPLPGSFGRSASHLVSNVLPKRFSDAVESTRSFAQARLRDNNHHPVCALIPRRVGLGYHKAALGEEQESLIVLTREGNFFQFGLDIQHGGECRLLEEKMLLREKAKLLLQLCIILLDPPNQTCMA